MTGSMMMAPARNVRRKGFRGSAVRNGGWHGKFVAMVLAVALACGGLAMFTTHQARSDAGATQVTSYIVRPGDTLWSYASAITPAGHDVSETVDKLIALNDLDSGALRAGQRIVIPVE